MNKDPITDQPNACHAASGDPTPCWCQEMQFPSTFKHLSDPRACLSEATIKVLQAVDEKYVLLEKYFPVTAGYLCPIAKSIPISVLIDHIAFLQINLVEFLNHLNRVLEKQTPQEITQGQVMFLIAKLMRNIAVMCEAWAIDPSHMLSL